MSLSGSTYREKGKKNHILLYKSKNTSKLAKLPKADVSAFPKLDDSNLWVWGGPTPYWGGNMADDALVTAADYFKFENGVYVYGATNEKTLQLHSGFKKLICQVNDTCRTPGAQEGLTNEKNAEFLTGENYQNVLATAIAQGVVDYLAR